MFHRSPILSFAIELLLYCIELQRTRSDRERKLAVLHLAQAVELTVKAALVEQNISIYEKGGRTLNTHDARDKLAATWGGPIPMAARVELLIDERNAIQHRYGNVDDLALDYHLETAVVFVREILREDFDVDLDGLIRAALPEKVWSSVRFVQRDQAAPPEAAPTDSLKTDESLVAKLLGGFAIFERMLRERIAAISPNASVRSALDVTMKFLAYTNAEQRLIQALPTAFTLRNSAAHGVGDLAEDAVKKALGTLDEVSTTLQQPANAAELAKAVEDHVKGRRGLAPLRLNSEQPEPPVAASADGAGKG